MDNKQSSHNHNLFSSQGLSNQQSQQNDQNRISQRTGQDQFINQQSQQERQRDIVASNQAFSQNYQMGQFTRSEIPGAHLNQPGQMMNRIYTPYTTTINQRHHRMTSGSGSISKGNSNMGSPTALNRHTGQKQSPPSQSELIQSLQSNLRNSFNNNNVQKSQQQMSYPISSQVNQALNPSEQEETMKESFNNLHEDDEEGNQIGGISPRNTTSMRPSMKKLRRQVPRLNRDHFAEESKSGRRPLDISGRDVGHGQLPRQDRIVNESDIIQDQQKKVESIETQEDIPVPRQEYDSEEDQMDQRRMHVSRQSELIVSGPFNQALRQKRVPEEGSEEYEEVDMDGNYADALLRNTKGQSIHEQEDDVDGGRMGGRGRAISSEYEIQSQGIKSSQKSIAHQSQQLSKLDVIGERRTSNSNGHQLNQIDNNQQHDLVYEDEVQGINRPSNGKSKSKGIRVHLTSFNRNMQRRDQPENISASPTHNDPEDGMLDQNDEYSGDEIPISNTHQKAQAPHFQIRSHQNLKYVKSSKTQSNQNNRNMNRFPKTTRHVNKFGYGYGDQQEQQNQENLIEQPVSPSSLSSGSNGEAKLPARGFHSPVNKFLQKQTNKQGSLGYSHTHSAAVLISNKKVSEKLSNQQYTLKNDSLNQIYEGTQRQKSHQQIQVREHRALKDPNPVNVRDSSTGNQKQGPARRATKGAPLMFNVDSNKKSFNTKSKSKNRQALRANPPTKPGAPRQPMNRTNVQLGGQMSANLVDQEMHDNESGPNRFTNDFTSPVVSKKKIKIYSKERALNQNEQASSPNANQFNFERQIYTNNGESQESEEYGLPYNPFYQDQGGEDALNPVENQGIPYPQNLSGSQYKNKTDESKKRVGRGKNQMNPSQTNNRLNVEDSDFQNVDEKVNENEYQNPSYAINQSVPLAQSHTAGKVRISINDEEIHNQIKHQNLNQIVENQVMHGSQLHSELFQGQSSSHRGAPRLPCGVRLQAAKPPPSQKSGQYDGHETQSQQQVMSGRRLPSKSVYVYNQSPSEPQLNMDNAKSIPNLKIDLQGPPLQQLNSNQVSLNNFSLNSVPSCSVFESIKQKGQSRLANLKQNMRGSFNSQRSDSKDILSSKTFAITEERQQKLIDEVYYDDGGFFSFFSSKPQRQRVAHQGRQSDLTPQPNGPSINDIDQSDYYSINTNRNLENYKEECRQKKEKRMQEQSKQLDSLESLWLMLDEQDDELIQSESCQLYTALGKTQDLSNKNKPNVVNQESIRKSSNEYLSMYQNCGIQFDYIPEVHFHAQAIMASTRDASLAHSIICHRKLHSIRNFMKLKIQKQQWLEECSIFNLRNSIVPAIQGHILLNLKMRNYEKEFLLNTVISNRNVYLQYRNACQSVQDWTQDLDFGPFEQVKQDKGDVLGECITGRPSTHEFFLHKQYQVDQDIIGINTKFNPSNCMFHVDVMGNLLSNMKLAFYEGPTDSNFISKYIQVSNQNETREILIQSYRIVRDIYDDILNPIRQRQIRDYHELQIMDNLQLNRFKAAMAAGRNLDEVKGSNINFDILQNEKEPDKHFYDYHCWHILDANAFRMTEQQYRDALIGLPTADGKSNGPTSQLFLRKKLERLKQELIESKNEYEFELVFYIQFLQSIQYNMNIFGQFNPLVLSEQDIIDNMK